MTKLRTILLLFASTACAAEDGSDETGADTGLSSESSASTGPSSTTDVPSTTDAETDDATSEISTTVDATSSSTDPTTATTTVADTGTESTGEGPTSGPGVLPGEGGLEAFCRRYVECGGTYYADQQDCIDASYDYWGDCASRAAALDEFGACMSEIECTDWNPDAYNPASTPCAEQWQGVGESDPC